MFFVIQHYRFFTKARFAVLVYLVISPAAYKSPGSFNSFRSRYRIRKADCSCVATARFMCVHSIISHAIADLPNHAATLNAFSKPKFLMNAPIALTLVNTGCGSLRQRMNLPFNAFFVFVNK